MLLEKTQLVHQPPSALLGILQPSGQPLALCSKASQKRLLQVQVQRAVSDAADCLPQVLGCRSVVSSLFVLLASE